MLECVAPGPLVQSTPYRLRHEGHDGGVEWPATDLDVPTINGQTRSRWSSPSGEICWGMSISERRGEASVPTPIDEQRAIVQKKGKKSGNAQSRA